MKGHIEPLNLQQSLGVWDVSLGEHLRNLQHLFEPMEMVQRRDKEILTNSVIATWTDIDPLAVALLFLVQGMLDDELNCVFEAVSHGAIVLLRIGLFREVILQNLLPVAQ